MESIHKINVEILTSALTFYANKTKRNIAYQHKWLSDSQTLDFVLDGMTESERGFVPLGLLIDVFGENAF
jgi:hypothetical protein